LTIGFRNFNINFNLVASPKKNWRQAIRCNSSLRCGIFTAILCAIQNNQMKKLNLIIIVFLIANFSFAQAVDFDAINYNGLNFYATKSEVIQKLGKPKKTYDPKYECGFLSSDTQNGEFSTLDYGRIKFTGNEKESYLLEYVNLENDPSIIIKYGNRNLTCETNLSELIEIFGAKLANHFGKKLDGAIIIFHKKADDGIRITIKNGKLIRFEYWSPC